MNFLYYPFKEILTERFYVIWYLLVEHGMEADFHLDKFSKKYASKGLNPADFHKKLAERLPQYKGRCKKSMSEQIQDNPKRMNT